MYWEESGTPDGIPALYLHGGPGGGLGAGGYRTKLDPDAVPDHRVRPARLRSLHTARERPAPRPRRQHHPAPDRRHRGAAVPPRGGGLAAQRRLVGVDPRPCLRAGASRAGAGDRADGGDDDLASRGRLDHRGSRDGLSRGVGAARPARRGGRHRLPPVRRAPGHGVRAPDAESRPGGPHRGGGCLGGVGGHPRVDRCRRVPPRPALGRPHRSRGVRDAGHPLLVAATPSWTRRSSTGSPRSRISPRS